MTFPEETEWWFSELKSAADEIEVPAEERMRRLRHRIMEEIDRMDRQGGSPLVRRMVFRDAPEQNP